MSQKFVPHLNMNGSGHGKVTDPLQVSMTILDSEGYITSRGQQQPRSMESFPKPRPPLSVTGSIFHADIVTVSPTHTRSSLPGKPFNDTESVALIESLTKRPVLTRISLEPGM